MKFLFVLLSFLMVTSTAAAKSATFSLNYEVITATGVCWQTCRFSMCEEAEYDIFWDSETFKTLESRENGEKYRVQNYECRGEKNVNLVDEHMPALMKENPEKAREILKNKGSKLKIVIYSNLSEELDNFLNDLLN